MIHLSLQIVFVQLDVHFSFLVCVQLHSLYAVKCTFFLVRLLAFAHNLVHLDVHISSLGCLPLHSLVHLDVQFFCLGCLYLQSLYNQMYVFAGQFACRCTLSCTVKCISCLLLHIVLYSQVYVFPIQSACLCTQSFVQLDVLTSCLGCLPLHVSLCTIHMFPCSPFSLIPPPPHSLPLTMIPFSSLQV